LIFWGSWLWIRYYWCPCSGWILRVWLTRHRLDLFNQLSSRWSWLMQMQLAWDSQLIWSICSTCAGSTCRIVGCPVTHWLISCWGDDLVWATVLVGVKTGCIGVDCYSGAVCTGIPSVDCWADFWGWTGAFLPIGMIIWAWTGLILTLSKALLPWLK
jgi:hypothetical protein